MHVVRGIEGSDKGLLCNSSVCIGYRTLHSRVSSRVRESEWSSSSRNPKPTMNQALCMQPNSTYIVLPCIILCLISPSIPAHTHIIPYFKYKIGINISLGESISVVSNVRPIYLTVSSTSSLRNSASLFASQEGDPKIYRNNTYVGSISLKGI